MYGPNRIYTRWVARALELWRQADANWDTELYRRTGALWLCGADDGYVRAALPCLAEEGLKIHELALADARTRFPQVAFDGIERVWLEEDAGTLFARRACRLVADAFTAEGGEYAGLEARPLAIEGERLGAVRLSDGSRFEADAFVFACGPWLPRLFPELLGPLRVSRQEVYYFGTPPASAALFEAPALPVWMDMSLGYYGLPPSEHRGFKVADDRRGPAFDPTSGDRIPSEEGVRVARAFLARRFPALRDAPLLEARVCQYTSTADNHLVVDRHPRASDLWLVGAGSGHGFKLGPALGEHVASLLLDGAAPDPQLSIERLARLGSHGDTLFDPAN